MVIECRDCLVNGQTFISCNACSAKHAYQPGTEVCPVAISLLSDDEDDAPPAASPPQPPVQPAAMRDAAGPMQPEHTGEDVSLAMGCAFLVNEPFTKVLELVSKQPETKTRLTELWLKNDTPHAEKLELVRECIHAGYHCADSPESS